MQVILTGATGVVGGEVLAHLLAHRAVERVTCLVRRPFARTDPKLDEIIQSDFGQWDEGALARLADQAGCYGKPCRSRPFTPASGSVASGP